VFVELPAAGTRLVAGKTFSSVESVKAVSEIYAPTNGEVLEANTALQNKPETINSDPHTGGWLVKIKLTNPSEVNDLMDAKAYEAYIAEKQKEASA
jgi:glycine cleavage system H protein